MVAVTWLAAASGQAATTLDDLVQPGAKSRVIGTGYGFSEGPTADAQGNVYFSDGMNDSIYFYQPGKPVVRFIAGSTDANGQKINSRGDLYTCEGVAHRGRGLQRPDQREAGAVQPDRRRSFQRAQRPHYRPARRILLHRPVLLRTATRSP